MKINRLWIIPLLFSVVLTIIFLQDQGIEKEEYPTPFGREEWRALERGGPVAPKKILEARNFIRGKYQSAKYLRDAGLRDWEYIGPKNAGGRVRTIAVHPTNPNIIYTGGVSGGIFKSTNAGASWSPLNDFLPSLSITSIIIHPDNPDILIASTGEGIKAGDSFNDTSPGAGIFRSQNGGNTWQLVPAIDPDSLGRFYWVNDLAFNTEDPNVFYAVAQGLAINDPSPNNEGRVYRFSGLGSTYEILPTPNMDEPYSVFVNPSDSGNIMVGHKDGLMMCWNGGLDANDWEENFDWPGFPLFPQRVEVAMSDSDPDIIYALCQGSVTASIAKSTNRGDTWSSALTGLDIFVSGAGNNQGRYDNVIWVDPLDADNLIIGGIDLYRSTDGGVSVTKISDYNDYRSGSSAHADHHVIVEASDFSNINRKVYFGNDGGIASTDNYLTVAENSGWNFHNNGLNITQFYASDVDGQSLNEIIAGSQDNGTWYSDDGGNTWEDVEGGDGGYCALNKQGVNPIYISVHNGDFRIKAGGLNFYVNYFKLEDYETGVVPFIAEMEIYNNDANKILVGGEHLWHVTYNGTANVKDVTPAGAPSFEFITSIDITEDSSHVIIGYSSGEIFLNDNGTAGSWTFLDPPVSGGVSDLAINPNDPDKIAVALKGYRDDNIWITPDGGTTWFDRSNGIPALHVNSITWHPDVSDWIYVGTDMGVMASDDDGKNWNVTPSQGNNDGPAMVEVSQVEFSRDNSFGKHWLIATTYGRGIWKTEYVVRKNIFLDNDCVTCGKGTPSEPFETIQEAVDRQASGQEWTFDEGNYQINNKIVIDKRIEVIKVDNGGKVVIKEN